jgi:hypothetical protein
MSYTRGSATLSPVRAYPNRAGFSAERISFRVTHLIASMFLCLFLGPVLKLGQVGLTQNSLETFSLNSLFDTARVNPSSSTGGRIVNHELILDSDNPI